MTFGVRGPPTARAFSARAKYSFSSALLSTLLSGSHVDSLVQAFREWASTLIGPDGLAINPASSVQLCTFLFGGAKNTKAGEDTEKVRVFKVPREEVPDSATEAYRYKK